MTARTYVVCWGALVLLTTLSFLLSMVSMGEPAGMLLGLTIGAGKATIVLLYFMHLIEQRFANRLVIGVSLLFVVVLVVLVMADPLTRHTFPPGPQPEGLPGR